MKKKKLVALTLTIAMAMSAFAASGVAAEEESWYDPTVGNLPIVTDPDNAPSFTIARNVDPQQTIPTSDLVMTKKLEEDTGIHIDWEEIPTVGLAEKVNLILSGGDLPDALWDCVTNDMISVYMGQDILIPVNDLEQYMPNLTKIYEDYPEYKALVTAPDGNRYGFPYIEQMYGLVLTPGPLLINKDWLDKVGKEVPTTTEEFADCLRAFKEYGDLNGNGTDDEIPYSIGMASTDPFDSYNSFNRFCMAFGTPTTAGNRTDDYMTVIDGKVTFTAADPAFRETCKFFHELYAEDLIDINSFTAGPNPRYPLYWDSLKGDTAIYGCISVWSPQNDIPNPDVRAQYVPVPRLEGPNGKIGEALNFSELQNATRFAITSACEHPEILARMVDYIYSPEMSISFDWSPEGYTFHYDENGKMVFEYDENGNAVIPEPWETIGEVNYNTRGSKGPTAIFNEYYEDKVEYDFAAQDLLEFQRVNGKEEYLEEITPVPPMLKTEEEIATLSQLQPQIKGIVDSYRMQWIENGDADETWDQYLADLDAAGLQQIVDVVQGAYDRYMSQQ